MRKDRLDVERSLERMIRPGAIGKLVRSAIRSFPGDLALLTCAMAVTTNGSECSVGVPTNFVPSSSQLSQLGNEPGGELNTGRSVSDAACGSQIFGSHS